MTRHIDILEGGKSLPPPVDKGVEIENSGKVPIDFRFHWMNFTVHEDPKFARRTVLVLLDMAHVDQQEFFKLSEKGSRGYKKMWVGEDQIRIYFHPSDGSLRYTVELPGEVMEKHVTWENLVNVFTILTEQKIKWKCTRLDIAFDMPARSCLTPTGINSYLRYGGLMRCAAERRTITFISPTYADILESVNGSTIYIGGRTSERFIRIYDKRGFTRLELELKKKKADGIFRQFLESGTESWCGLAKSYLLDYIDLPDHSDWNEFTNGVIRPARIGGNIIEKNLKNSQEWFEHAASPTMAMLTEIHGWEYVAKVVSSGRGRLTERQRMMIKNADGMRRKSQCGS